MAVMSTSSNAAHIQVYYERVLLDTLEPRVVLAPLGRPGRIPGGQGPTIRWTRWDKIASSTTPLTEGTNPAEIQVPSNNIDATALQYGQFSKVSDRLSFHAISPVVRDLSVRFGFAAAETVEDLIVAELDAQAAIQRVNNRVDDDAILDTDVLNHKELLEAQVQQKLDFIGPHEVGDYVAVLNAAAEFDMKSDQQAGSWLDLRKFGGPDNKLLNGEFGRMYGMRLLVSDKTTSVDNASSVPVRKNYLIGQEAYGTVDLRGKKRIEMIMKDERSGGVANPLNMFSTVGYKIKGYAAKYLDAGTKRVIQIRAASAVDA